MIGYGIFAISNNSDIAMKSRVNPVWATLTNYYSGDNTPNDKKSSSNGTLVNGATYGTGKNNNCFSFDGVNDYVSFPSDFFEPAGSFSINLWFKTSSASTQTIMSLTNASGLLGFRIYVAGASTAISFHKFYSGASTNTLNSVGGKWTSGSWNMATIVSDITSGMYIYVNGALAASNATTNAISWGSSTLQRLGANYDGGTPFNGLIDEVAPFNTALSLSDHQTMYNSGNGIFY